MKEFFDTCDYFSKVLTIQGYSHNIFNKLLAFYLHNMWNTKRRCSFLRFKVAFLNLDNFFSLLWAFAYFGLCKYISTSQIKIWQKNPRGFAWTHCCSFHQYKWFQVSFQRFSTQQSRFEWWYQEYILAWTCNGGVFWYLWLC